MARLERYEGVDITGIDWTVTAAYVSDAVLERVQDQRKDLDWNDQIALADEIVGTRLA